MAEIIVKLVNGELAGKTMQGITKEIQALTLAQKKAEVGTKEFVETTLKLNAAKDLQKDLKKQIDATASASDQLKAAWNRLPGAQFFNQIGQSFGMMKSGVGGLVSSFGVLKTAIAATGIGLLVLVLGSLYTWFTKTEEGADKLKSVIYPLQVLFQKFTGILAELGGKVFKRLTAAFNDPVQAIKDLGSALYDNVLKRIESLAKFGPALVKIFTGEFVDGFKDLGDATIQLTTGIENGIDKITGAANEIGKVFNKAYDEGQKLLDLENAIEDAEVALTLSRAKLNVAISENGKIARDTLETDQKRLEAAKLVQVLQDKSTQQEEHFLALKLQRLKVEQDTDKILTDDERLERAKLEAEIIQLQADGIDKNKKARALEINLIEEIAKRELDIAKNIATLKVEAMREGLDKEIEQIVFSTTQKIDALAGSEEQILIQKVYLQEIQEQQVQAIKDKYANDAALHDKKVKEDEANRDRKAADDKKKLAQDVKDFEYKLGQERMGIGRDIASSAADLLASSMKNEKHAKNIRKTAAVAEIGMNLIQELSLNAKNAAANPSNAVTYGAAGSAQLALANGLSIVRAALSTAKVVAFKKGGVPGIPDGVLQGPSHEQGGIPLVAEGNEIILTKGVYNNPTLKAIASDINVAGGGRRFASGGPTSPFQDRAPIPSSRSILSPSSSQSSNEMPAWLPALIDAQDRKISRLKVYNVVSTPDKTGYQDQIDILNDIKSNADV